MAEKLLALYMSWSPRKLRLIVVTLFLMKPKKVMFIRIALVSHERRGLKGDFYLCYLQFTF